MGRWVLLEHTLPDGARHYDWLIDPDGRPETPLMSFRTMARVDRPGEGGFEAERIHDHRRVYLEYEGEISGGRGSVRRVAAGPCRVERCDRVVQLSMSVDEPGAVWWTCEGAPSADGLPRYRFTAREG